MPTRVAINGLGHIGRATLKIVNETPELELVEVVGWAREGADDDRSCLHRRAGDRRRASQQVAARPGAAVEFVPTSTAAAQATTQTLPQYEGRLDGIANRRPGSAGSVADLTIVTGRDTSVDEINRGSEEEAGSNRYQGVMGAAYERTVSSDVIRDARGSLVNPTMTQVVGGKPVKVMGWDNNECGDAAPMVREAVRQAA